MTLRARTFFIIGPTFVGLIVALYIVARSGTSRDVYSQGEATVLLFVLSLLGVCLVFGAVTLLLMEKQVLSRLARLSANVAGIAAQGDPTARIAVSGRDEPARVGGSINAMPAAVEGSQHNLRESEERYRAVVEQSSEGMYLADVGTKRILEANTACLRLLGLTSSEILDLTLYDIIGHDRESIDRNIHKAMEAGHHKISERQYRRKDGSYFDVEVSANRISYGGREVLCVVIRDVTEQRQYEAQLRRNNVELAALHDTTLGVINHLDLNGLLEVILDRAAALLGTEHGYIYLVDPLKREEMSVRIGTGVFVANVGYRLKRGEGVAGRAWETGEPVVVEDYASWSGRRDDLDRMALRALVGIPLRSGGEVTGVLGLAYVEEGRVISPEEVDLLRRFGQLASLALENSHVYTTLQKELGERKRAEEELKKECDFISAVVDTAGTLVVLTDRQGRIVSFNNACEDISGYLFEEVEGQFFYDIFLVPEEVESVTAAFKEPQAGAFPNKRENYWLTRSGERRLIAWSNTALLDRGGEVEYLISTGIDITASRQAEEVLRVSEKKSRALFAAAERQAQELALLDEVRTALTRELDLPVLIRTVVETISKAFGYKQVSIYLLEGDTLVMQHQVGYETFITRLLVNRGVMGMVARTGKPVLLEDVNADTVFVGALQNIVSEVCVPISDQGRVVGVLNVETVDGAKLGGADLRLITALAEHVNIAVGRARLYTEMRESEARYRSVVNNVKEVIYQTDAAGVWTFLNPAWTDTTGFTHEESLGTPLLNYVHPDDRCEAWEKMVAVVADKDESCRHEIRYLTKEGSFRWMEVHAQATLGPGGEIVGASGSLNDITERKRAVDTLRELAIRDGLTGLYNRREMERLLKEEVSRFERYGGSVALLMLDIDHFKLVNDTYGHQAGDEVLQWIARLLRENMRSVDRLARYGGEELAVILPETTETEAYTLAEFFRQTIAAQPFIFEDGNGHPIPIPITVSIGVAGIPNPSLRSRAGSCSEDTIVASADLALYEAKRLGRNRVIPYAAVSRQSSVVSRQLEIRN